jgi:hypothetical protein
MPLLILLAVALLLQGCTALNRFDYAHDIGSAEPIQWPKLKGEVTIVWRFGSPEWVNTMCQPVGSHQDIVHGCAMLDPRGERCLVFAVEPYDFKDRNRLAVMGHELWHCFGAKHA